MREGEGRGEKSREDVETEAQLGLEMLSVLCTTGFLHWQKECFSKLGRDDHAFCLELGRGTWLDLLE